MSSIEIDKNSDLDLPDDTYFISMDKNSRARKKSI